MKQTKNLVSAQWLTKHLADPDIVVVDCRFTLGKPGLGLSHYTEEHIPGALYFDLDHDLSAPVSKHGGRHPLPSVEKLTELFSQAGIDKDVTVVAYDEQDLAYAARLWWLLRYLGHEQVYVLDGGFTHWTKTGYPVTTEIVSREPRSFVPHIQTAMLASVDDVRNAAEEVVLIDSRAPERYRGEIEPLDPKAGHIPGAVNRFYKDNFSPDHTLRPEAELKERFHQLTSGKEPIVYCGSGVTACVNVLALYEAGRKETKLYAGSWSDWCSYDLPVAKGDE